MATYGLENEMDAMPRYLETHGEVDDDRLPEYFRAVLGSQSALSAIVLAVVGSRVCRMVL